MGHRLRWRPGRLSAVPLAVALTFGACATGEHRQATEEEINPYPANYKTDILGAVHAYLGDPTNIRDAAVSEPVLTEIGPASTAVAMGIVAKKSRYVACVRFNAKKSNGEYAGVRVNAAVFLAGRLDQFAPAPRDMCKDAVYRPFPELAKLSR
jgi:hypothetical protein